MLTPLTVSGCGSNDQWRDDRFICFLWQRLKTVCSSQRCTKFPSLFHYFVCERKMQYINFT